MKKADVVKQILPNPPAGPAKAEGRAAAPANIALCKYWGKRNEELNLPVTASLSISLGSLGTETAVTLNQGDDEIVLNGRPVPPRAKFVRGVIAFLDLFRASPEMRFRVTTANSIPTAAGLASSASGFAALTLALRDLFGWTLAEWELSLLARLGSGSACRSIFRGFVEWHAGAREDGLDSYAEPLPEQWPDLRLGLLVVSAEEKDVSSRQAMKRTKRTSALYESWPVKVAHDLVLLKEAISSGNFELLGRVAESNALSMHATGLGAWPPVLFWRPESVALMHRVWALREEGLPLFFTMDAGPNLKLLFMAEDADAVQKAFPEIQIVVPFPAVGG